MRDEIVWFDQMTAQEIGPLIDDSSVNSDGLASTRSIAGLAASLKTMQITFANAESALQGRIDDIQLSLTETVSNLLAYVDGEIVSLSDRLATSNVENATALAMLLDDSTEEASATTASIAGLASALEALKSAYEAADGSLEDMLAPAIARVEGNLTSTASELAAYVDGQVARLDAAIASGDATLSASLAQLIDNAVYAEDGSVQSAATTASIAGLSSALEALRAAYQSGDGALWVAVDGRIDQVQRSLDAAIERVTDDLDARVAALTGDLSGASYDTLRELSDVIVSLEGATASTSSQLAALDSSFGWLLNVLAGRGALLSVAEATELQSDASDPLHILLTNYRISDAAASILGLDATAPVVMGAKDIIVESGVISSAMQAQKLVALRVNLVQSDYDVSGTASALTQNSTWPSQVTMNATDITVTDTPNIRKPCRSWASTTREQRPSRPSA